jgi:hypothetical protein
VQGEKNNLHSDAMLSTQSALSRNQKSAGNTEFTQANQILNLFDESM